MAISLIALLVSAPQSLAVLLATANYHYVAGLALYYEKHQ